MEILVEKLGLRESPRPLLSFRGHSVCHDTDEAEYLRRRYYTLNTLVLPREKLYSGPK